MTSQQILLQIPFLKKASYLTHARCSNDSCEYYGYFFEKPITRCPFCNISLRQVPRKRIFKELHLENMSKLEKTKKIKRDWKRKNQKKVSKKDKKRYKINPEPYKKATKKWRVTHKNHISNYNKNYYQTIIKPKRLINNANTN